MTWISTRERLPEGIEGREILVSVGDGTSVHLTFSRDTDYFPGGDGGWLDDRAYLGEGFGADDWNPSAFEYWFEVTPPIAPPAPEGKE
jgi:hypothetical protein